MMPTPFARDTAMLARASWAVASSETMPRWRAWMEWNDARRRTAERVNPPSSELARALTALVRRRQCTTRESLPWAAARCPPSRRIVAALVSFVDDYRGPIPSEMFPRDQARDLRIALRDRKRGRALAIDEQLEVALDASEGNIFAAAVLLHAVTRLVARNRDTRALGSLSWEERLTDASWIAPFPRAIAGRGDAPGDTYHYWATFVAGLHSELRRTLVPRAVGVLFAAGPLGMTVVRGGIFGATLFAGAHARCDWLGLRHGRAAARAAGDLGRG
jgi:hypothetical protein